jgi:hypothetical protein
MDGKAGEFLMQETRVHVHSGQSKAGSPHQLIFKVRKHPEFLEALPCGSSAAQVNKAHPLPYLAVA